MGVPCYPPSNTGGHHTAVGCWGAPTACRGCVALRTGHPPLCIRLPGGPGPRGQHLRGLGEDWGGGRGLPNGGRGRGGVGWPQRQLPHVTAQLAATDECRTSRGHCRLPRTIRGIKVIFSLHHKNMPRCRRRPWAQVESTWPVGFWPLPMLPGRRDWSRALPREGSQATQ